MKTKTILGLLPLAALALIMGACDNDEVLDSENGWQGERVAMTFTAEIPQTRIARVGAVLLVVAQRTPHLERLEVASKRSARGHAHRVRRGDTVLHPYIEHARGIHAAKTAALEYDSYRMLAHRGYLNHLKRLHSRKCEV